MRFADVKHQERAISILRRALGSGRSHHAYLLEGPEGVGKELTARALAARLLCEQANLAADADSCGECRSCRLVDSANHPDFHIIDRSLHKMHPDRTIRNSKGLFLVVDVVRRFLIEPATVAPSMGPQRVFLIREAERMNTQAQNALLKTLEEPPGDARLILVSASASELLPTIQSRCQRVRFGLLPPAYVREQLAARLKLNPADAQTLASLGGGSLGLPLRWHELGMLATLDEVGAVLLDTTPLEPEPFAKTLLEIAAGLAKRITRPQAETGEEPDAEPAETEETDEALEQPDAAGGKSGAARVGATDEVRSALKLIFSLIAAFYRDALHLQSKAPANLLHLPTQRERTRALAVGTPADLLDESIRAVARAETMIDRNVTLQLVCERLATVLSGAAPVE